MTDQVWKLRQDKLQCRWPCWGGYFLRVVVVSDALHAEVSRKGVSWQARMIEWAGFPLRRMEEGGAAGGRCLRRKQTPEPQRSTNAALKSRNTRLQDCGCDD